MCRWFEWTDIGGEGSQEKRPKKPLKGFFANRRRFVNLESW